MHYDQRINTYSGNSVSCSEVAKRVFYFTTPSPTSIHLYNAKFIVTCDKTP
jgi:hypothetical protein